MLGERRSYLVSTTPEGKTAFERDLYRCQHCGANVHVAPFRDPAEFGGVCRRCGERTCLRCAAAGDCDPLLEKLERAERRAARIALEQVGRMQAEIEDRLRRDTAGGSVGG